MEINTKKAISKAQTNGHTKQSSKSQAQTLAPDLIPAELKERRQWLVWRYEQRKGNKTKVPYSPHTRKTASVDDPATWSGFDQAVKTCQQSRGHYHGIGYVFAADDPYCGIDLDKCISDDGTVDPDKLRWIEAFNSYTETTPSGRGFHIIVRGAVKQGHNDQKRGFEIYSSGRYFTFTGHSHHNEAMPIVERQAVIDRFVEEVFTKPKPRAKAKKPQQRPDSAVTIEDRLQAAFSAKNGARVKALFTGDTSAYKGDDSAADLALCSSLAFWSDGDSSTLDAMFRKSLLMRPKWGEKHYSDGRTYGEETINKALSDATEFYEWQRATSDTDVGNTQNEPTDAPPLIQTWGELDAQDLPVGEQIIHELERGEIGLLAAVTNVGKSTLLRNVALSLACGREFLPIVKRGPARRVLLLDFETRPARLQRDLRKMAEKLTSEEQEMIRQNLAIACNATLNDEPLCLSEPQHLRWIQMYAAAFKPDIIIVDTVAAAFTLQDENSNAEVNRRILKPMVRLAHDTDAAILMAHHIGKGKSEDGKSNEKAYRARGASSFGGYAALVLNLSQEPNKQAHKVLSLAKSKGAQFDDVMLNLDQQTRWFTVTNEPVKQTLTSYDWVVRLFRDGKTRTTKEVEKALPKMPRATVARCLSEAVNNGDLTKPKRGQYRLSHLSQPYREETSETNSKKLSRKAR